MKALAGLIAALGAGLGGYAKGVQMFNDEERAKTKEAREEEEYQYQKGQRDKATKLERDLADSQKDVTPSPVTNTGATYTDEDLVAADNRENRRMAEQSGNPVPTPMTVTNYTANGQQFGDLGSAKQALLGVNSQSEKLKRAAAVYGANGMIDKQQQYLQFAQNAINEGTDKVLTSIQSAAPSVDALKKANGSIDGKIPKDAMDTFNSTGGKWKLDNDHKVQYYLDKDAAGRDIVNFRVYGKEGTPVVENGRTASLMLADMKTRLEQQNSDTRTYQTGQQIAEAGRHNLAEEGIQARTAAIAAGHLGIAQQRLNMDKEQLKKQSLAGQIAQIESVTGPLDPDTKKNLGLKLAGLKSTDDDGYTKLIDKVVEEGVKAGSIKPEDSIKTAMQLRKSLGAAKIEETVATDLSSKVGTPDYEKSYFDARDKLGIPESRLKQLGFAPPPKAGSGAKVASSGVSPSAKAAPAASPDDIRLNEIYKQLNEQTKEMDAGKRSSYDPNLVAEMDAIKAKKMQIGNKAFLDQEKQRALRASRAQLGLQ